MLSFKLLNIILNKLSTSGTISVVHIRNIRTKFFRNDIGAVKEDDFVFHNIITSKKDESFKGHNGCDEPISLNFNPYNREPRKCILCKHKIKLDYKNSRLLQQFVSSFRHSLI